MGAGVNPWGAVLALHLLCAALWVGGMAFALMVVRPSLGALDPAQRTAVTSQVFRRFFLIVWHAMPLLLLSGYAMLFGYYDGFAGVNWSVHTMHALGLIMAVIFLYVFFGPWPKFRAAVSPQRAAGNADRIRKLILVNLVLGLVTIAVAGLGAL
ncbi:MAG: CopD family protein [Acetobacteraceae bacterium]|nr:CopD family protein [Acetobacteraceae bacterium]